MATNNKIFNYIFKSSINKTKNVINRSFNIFLKITEEKTAKTLNKPASKSRINKFIKETTKTVSENVRRFITKSKTNVKKSITNVSKKTAEPKKIAEPKKAAEPKKIADDKYFKFTEDGENIFVDDDDSEFNLSEKKPTEPKKTFEFKDDKY